MRRPRLMILIALVIFVASSSALATGISDFTYVNPVIGVGSADPAVIKASDGRYYLYNTFGFTIWSSDDLVHWRNEGSARPADSWGVKDFWAPEVIEYRGRFYLFYSAEWLEGGKRVGVAVSENPTGPFGDLGRPLFDFGYAAIDAHPFIDDDGRAYIFFAKDQALASTGRHESHIYGAELSEDLFSVRSEPVLLTRPDQLWEWRSGNRLWNEGPYVIKRDGMYYLMYSANYFGGPDYSVGYATASEPLGPYRKYGNNPILSRGALLGRVSGPGHHSVVASPDGTELFMVYHVHANPATGGGDRRIAIDRLGFREDGSLYVSGPTVTPQPLPAGSTDLVNIAPYAKVVVSSAKVGHSAGALTDGEFSVDPSKVQGEWASDQEGAGAWVRLEWAREQRARWVLLYGSALGDRRVSSGTLRLSDGTTVEGIQLPREPGAAAIVEVPDDRDILWLEFVVDEMAVATGTAALAEVVVLGHSGGLPTDEVGSVWLSSPRRGSVVTADVPVRVEVLHVSASSVRVELDGETIYSGADVPEALGLRVAALPVGDHQVTAAVVDEVGREYRYAAKFTVEHLRLTLPTAASGRLSGDVPIGVNVILPAAEVAAVEVGVVPISLAEVGQEMALYAGGSAPEDLVWDTFSVEDGAYDLVVRVRTNAGVVSTVSERVVVDNWEVLDDPISLPLDSGWFGRVDRIKTVDASAGWVFAEDRPEVFFGDVDRIRREHDGTEHLTWYLPRLQRFALTLYAGTESIGDTVTVAISPDGQVWTNVQYAVEVAGRSADGDVLMLQVTGLVPPAQDAAYLRLLFVENGLCTEDLQLGHVRLEGFQQDVP